jgi:Immunity protein Imm6
METDSMAMLASASVPLRVAFAVAIGYAALPNIRGDIEGVAFARRALDDAARWAAGESVEAEALVDYLMNEREEGVLLFEDRCPDEACRQAWMPVQTALAYAAWQARRAQGALAGSMLSEVSEETLALLRQQAIDAGQSQHDLDALQIRVERMISFDADDVAGLVAPN